MQDIINTVKWYASGNSALRDKVNATFAVNQFLGSLLIRRNVDSICLSTIASYMVSSEVLVAVSRDGIQSIGCEGGTLVPLCSLPNSSPTELSGVAAISGRALVCSGNGISTYEGKNLRAATECSSYGYAQNILCVSCTPDGEYIATGGGNATVNIWTGDTKPLHHLSGHTDWVRFVKFARGASPSLQLFSTGDDGVICQWDPLSGCLLSRLDYSRGQSIQVFEVSYWSGLIAVTSNKPVIALYCCLSSNSTHLQGDDVLRLQQLGLIADVHQYTPTAAKFTEDSQWIASASEDETLAVSSVAEPRQCFICREFVTRRHCLSFMNIFTSICILAAPPFSSTVIVAACSSDGTVVQWVVDPRRNRIGYTKKLQLHMGALLSMDLISAALIT